MNTGKRVINAEFECFLTALAPEAQAQLRRHTIEAGTSICQKGDLIQKVFLLCDGYAQEFCESSESSGMYRVTGSMFGMEDLLDGISEWPINITAATECDVIELDAEVFLASLNDKKVVMALLEQTLTRGRTIQSQFIESMSQ